VHILAAKLDEQDVARDELQIIKEELDRAGQILLRLPGITEQKTTLSGAALLDVNTLITDLLKIFRSSLFTAQSIEALVDLDEAMQPIICDRNALKQILTNLIKNASEALSAGGRITVETQAQVNFNGRNYVEIVIADNGPGISEQVQERLFTPVQTTKGGDHAGLGLSIVKNLVDNLDGSISCRSSARNGTRFEILIPRILE
jgi:signal transduction histidine kinase